MSKELANLNWLEITAVHVEIIAFLDVSLHFVSRSRDDRNTEEVRGHS